MAISLESIVSRYLIQKRKASLGSRPTYSDGRLIPQPGDKVYQEVGGLFGTGGWLEGVVLSGGKQVRVTGGAALFGDIPKGKRYKLTKFWTVVNDPAVKARQEARERAKAEEDIKQEQEKLQGEKAIEDAARKLGVRRIKNIREVHPGDVVYHLCPNYSDPSKAIVNKVAVKEVESKFFTYTNEHGAEITSGNVENWWK